MSNASASLPPPPPPPSSSSATRVDPLVVAEVVGWAVIAAYHVFLALSAMGVVRVASLRGGSGRERGLNGALNVHSRRAWTRMVFTDVHPTTLLYAPQVLLGAQSTAAFMARTTASLAFLVLSLVVAASMAPTGSTAAAALLVFLSPGQRFRFLLMAAVLFTSFMAFLFSVRHYTTSVFLVCTRPLTRDARARLEHIKRLAGGGWTRRTSRVSSRGGSPKETLDTQLDAVMVDGGGDDSDDDSSASSSLSSSSSASSSPAAVQPVAAPSSSSASAAAAAAAGAVGGVGSEGKREASVDTVKTDASRRGDGDGGDGDADDDDDDDGDDTASISSEDTVGEYLERPRRRRRAAGATGHGVPWRSTRPVRTAAVALPGSDGSATHHLLELAGLEQDALKTITSAQSSFYFGVRSMQLALVLFASLVNGYLLVATAVAMTSVWAYSDWATV